MEKMKRNTEIWSGYLMTQIYCQGVKMTMHLSIVIIKLYNVCIVPLPIYTSMAWCLEMRAVLPPTVEKNCYLSYI